MKFDDLDKDIQDIVKKIEEYNIGGVSTPPPFGAPDNTKKTAPDGEWWIPKGFEEAEDSGETIKDGKVIQDEAGNQFVWVPCYLEGGVGQDVASATEYKRTDFGKSNENYSDFQDGIITNEKMGVKQYGGFYIGRYEAGADTEVSSEDTTRKVLIQKNKYPYNYIDRSTVMKKSDDFANSNKYDTDKMCTTIVSSYAWDTALCFIQKTVTDYATNSTQGNYSGSLKNTGLTTPVCNIYDMGGNLEEVTSEYTDIRQLQSSVRGGSYKSMTEHTAGYRNSIDYGANNNIGFRISLYLK